MCMGQYFAILGSAFTRATLLVLNVSMGMQGCHKFKLSWAVPGSVENSQGFSGFNTA